MPRESPGKPAETAAGGAVYAAILAGGSGERLWPLSVPERPKQFVDLFGGKPLIRHATDRLAGFIPPDRTIVVTAERFAEETRRALPEIPAENIYAEPCRRNTAGAIAVACAAARRRGGPDAVVCALSADQLIEPADAFRRTLADAAAAAACTRSIVVMGVAPAHPATGYGYIECGERVDAGTATRFDKVERFVEKPDAETAGRYIATGRFRWNAGMFIWQVSAMEAELAACAPDIAAFEAEAAGAENELETIRERYGSLRNISIDYAVLEKSRNVIVAECNFRWDDAGTWLSVPNHFPCDSAGNTLVGNATVLDTSGAIVVSDKSHRVAVYGLDDVVVVHTPGATLVCSRERAADLKPLVRVL